ncbi:GH32 C-terminal domain-containing protein [Haloterrigena salifodinae]|uniref:GH32 C-terminal domain-containing protein n=1 Tax=Haloterrigena salifodinae TaxID=2675099 RepID=UPI002011BCD2|nr:GH32 C-terminal domain-containing protein [Haloterrigena salifodinae]
MTENHKQSASTDSIGHVNRRDWLQMFGGIAVSASIGGALTGSVTASHTESKIGDWPLDEGSGDSTVESVAEYRKHVAYKGDRDPLWVDGKGQNGLLFDGYTTWAAWEADELAPEFSQELSELTIDTWVAPCSHGSESNYIDPIIEKRDRSAQQGFTFGVDNYGHWTFQVGLGDSWEEIWVKSDDLIDVYEWNHLTAVFDGNAGSLQLYKDGTLVAENSTPTGTIGPVDVALKLGRNSQMDYIGEGKDVWKQNMFNGAVSQLETYDAALSGSEIQSKHNNEIGDLTATGYQELTVNPQQYDGDNYRPEYHAIAPTHWMNEPHGPLYFDGKYHLFYQHNPKGSYWRQIHWGHWVSDDMVHWNPVEEALRPEEGIDPAGCWSGDAVVDADGCPKLLYTAGLTEGTDDQAIAEATSTFPEDDDVALTDWNKQGVVMRQPDDPDLMKNEFRDPHVWQENGEWYCLVGSGLQNGGGGTVLAFHSTDCVNWNYEGRALQLDSPDDYPHLGDNWELPVLLPLGTDANGNEKHVLCISPQGGDTEVWYWIGTWDTANFEFVRDHQDPLLIDEGDFHFTGPSGFVDPQTGRSILFTIAQDHRKEQLWHDSGWAHNAGTPMELSLRDDGRLGIAPIGEMESARSEKLLDMNDADPALVDDALENLTANTVELQLEIESNGATEYGFYSHHSPDGEEKTLVYYDESTGEIKTDRNQTSQDSTLMEAEQDKSNLTTQGPVDVGSDNLRLRAFIDKSLIECYVNSLKSVTTRAYPSRDDSTELRLYRDGDITVRSIEIWEMEDIQNGQPSSERYRPGYHFERESGWMNDPNGLVYHDGTYHMFYQAGESRRRWDHAISTDLVNWTEQGTKIPDTDSVQAYSGGAVVDVNDTAGFGENTIVTMYTGHHDGGEEDQRIAYSTDGGDTFTKYGGNPVLDEDTGNWRDPNPFWYDPTGNWRMVVARVEGNGPDRPAGIEIYESDDLKNWTYLSTYESDGVAWECPDLFELPVENADERRWVMTVSVDADHVEHHVGQFDGMTFVADNEVYADSGRDFYAAQSWTNEPATDSRLGLAWTSHWDYAADTPEDGWKGAQSFPRRITLRDTGSGIVPIQRLDGAVESNRKGVLADLSDEPLSPTHDPLAGTNVKGEMLELLATIDPGTADAVVLELRKGISQETRVTYDVGAEELFVDRGDAGAFFGDTDKDVASQPVALRDDGTLTVRVFVDRSIISTFANDGKKTMTNRIYPDETSVHATMTANGGTATIESLTAWDYSEGLVDGATYRIENRNSGKVLEVRDGGTGDGDAVQQWEWWGGDSQKWIAHEVNDGVFQFENRNSGKVLEVRDGGTGDGDAIQQWEWWDGDNQRWTVDRTPDGHYRVRNANSGRVLDVEDASTSDGTRCVQWEWWDGDNQKWNFKRLK